MTKALSYALITTYPEYFNVATPPVRGGFYGFECGDGWFRILSKLLYSIKEEGLGLDKVLQVKEKFGGLRFYVQSDGSDRLRELIGKAETAAVHTCEMCGKEGSVRSDGWMKTLCDAHHAEREIAKRLNG